MKIKENEKLKFLFSGLIIGLISGLMLTIYRKLVVFFSAKMLLVYNFGRENIFYAIFVIIFITLLGMFVGILTQKEPMIGGSGIPQVMGQLKDKISINWKRVLSYKFVGGLISLSSGLTVGREGPSVQMGASVGQAFSEITNKNNDDTKILITAGAASGLSAAFNAPISGILFVLEELHHNFNKYVFIAATASAITSDYISSIILGSQPVINLGFINTFPSNLYPILVLLGIIVGFLAPIFSFSIYKCKNLYKSLPLPKFIKITIPFIITAIIILFFPINFGSGEHFIFLPNENNNYEIHKIILIGITKFLLLVFAFSSGLPGGIFLPMLVLGSLIGNVFGQILVNFGVIGSEHILILSAVAMCANFAAIVRSPLTAIMLTVELTGSFNFFLPIAVVVLTSYIIVELLDVKPIYSGLLEILLKDNTK